MPVAASLATIIGNVNENCSDCIHEKKIADVIGIYFPLNEVVVLNRHRSSVFK